MNTRSKTQKAKTAHFHAGRAARKALPHTDGKPNADALMELLSGIGSDDVDGDGAAGDDLN